MKKIRAQNKKKSLRPTSGKVREAVFDILRMHINDARFLDLYAGTGAVGINAIREGASEVVFVEESMTSSREIKKLLLKYRLTDKAHVITKKVLSFIVNTEPGLMPFDIVFLDPPYHSDEILQALSAIDSSEIVKADGFVVAEHFAARTLPEHFKRLNKVKDYSYGDTVLSVYRCS